MYRNREREREIHTNVRIVSKICKTPTHQLHIKPYLARGSSLTFRHVPEKTGLRSAVRT